MVRVSRERLLWRRARSGGVRRSITTVWRRSDVQQSSDSSFEPSFPSLPQRISHLLRFWIAGDAASRSSTTALRPSWDDGAIHVRSRKGRGFPTRTGRVSCTVVRSSHASSTVLPLDAPPSQSYSIPFFHLRRFAHADFADELSTDWEGSAVLARRRSTVEERIE